MGFDPESIAHIKMSHEKGIGTLYDYTVVGDGIDVVRRNFRRR